MKSWLQEEKARPLCIFRTHLFEEQHPKWDTAAEVLTKAAKAAGPELLEAIVPALLWIETGEGENPNLTTPEAQAAWGFALLADKSRPRSEQKGPAIIASSSRIKREKYMMAAMLLGSVQDKKTLIGWGEPGSWFYHDPNNHRINMDPATALMIGIQNARSICLHEIGHAAITRGISPKIEALINKIENLREETEDGEFRIPKESVAEANRLGREYKVRTSFWQYTEDAAVNTFAELEGETFPTNIRTAALRCYASTLMGRERATKKEDPLNGFLNALKEMIFKDPLEKPPTEKEIEEIKVAEVAKKQLGSLLKAAAAAYPISRGWMDTSNPEDWAEIGTELTPEASEITQALCGPNSLAEIQPKLKSSRLDSLRGLAEEIAQHCADERNRICDELFDKLLLPLLEKIPLAPPAKNSLIWKEGTPTEKKSGGENPGEGEPTEKGEEEPEEITLEEGSRLLKEQDAKEGQSKIDATNKRGEAQKKSMGVGSPMTTLPTDCTSYPDAVEKCRAQISHVSRLLNAIKKTQSVPGQQKPALMPENGLQDFDLDAYYRSREKIASGERLVEADFHFFKESLQKEKPALTRLVFYIDGSGSMHNEQTKQTMLTAIIFCEAAKKTGDTNVTMLYSGEEKTELLCNGSPTDAQKEVIGGILHSGIARGSNEICNSGLQELQAALIASAPINKAVGATHIVFLSDGGSSYAKQAEITDAITTTLDNNPLSSFDTIITDGSEGEPFREASEAVKTKRSNQQPGLHKASDPSVIAEKICSCFSQRLRQMKSFSPQTSRKTLESNKKTERRLKAICPNPID